MGKDLLQIRQKLNLSGERTRSTHTQQHFAHDLVRIVQDQIKSICTRRT